MGADIKVGGGEAVADEVVAARHGAFEGVHDGLVAAVAGHGLAAPLRRQEAEGLVGDGGLERPGGEEQPAVIGAAQAAAGLGREAGLREGIGQVGADRRRLRDDDVAVADGRHLAHRVDGEIGRRLHGRAEIEHLGAIRLADLLQHPAGDAAARHRVGVEDQVVGHLGAPRLVGHSAVTDCRRIGAAA